MISHDTFDGISKTSNGFISILSSPILIFTLPLITIHILKTLLNKSDGIENPELSKNFLQTILSEKLIISKAKK